MSFQFKSIGSSSRPGSSAVNGRVIASLNLGNGKSAVAVRAPARAAGGRIEVREQAQPRPQLGQRASRGGRGPNPNQRVVMNCISKDSPRLAATADPFDRAHDRVDLSDQLIPAAVAVGRSRRGKPIAVRPTIVGAEPRRYDKSYVNHRGIAVDSQFDWLHDAQQRLAGVPGVGDAGTTRDRVMDAVRAARPETLRGLTRGVTKS